MSRATTAYTLPPTEMCALKCLNIVAAAGKSGWGYPTKAIPKTEPKVNQSTHRFRFEQTHTHTHTQSESNEMLEPFVWSLSSNGKLLWKLITNSWGQSFFGDNRVGAKLGWGSFPGYEFMGRYRLFKIALQQGAAVPPVHSPRVTPTPPLFFGCHAECVRVRVHFLVFSLPPWHFPKHSAASSAAKWIFGRIPCGFLWIPFQTDDWLTFKEYNLSLLFILYTA